MPLASVIIDNFNYARFLGEAIDSALAQAHPATEVIIVDDGSTDESRAVIARYGGRVRVVLKENGGQASALNAGFAISRGDVVLFLDSDDVLLPRAVENAVRRFDDAPSARSVAKVQWPLWVTDEQGNRRGDTKPPRPPPQGDLRAAVLENGPTSCVSSPTSGNAWSRAFLDWAMPVPEDVPYYRVCADEYLYTLAPVFGDVRTIAEPQGLYRIHGQNIYSARTFESKLRLELDGHGQQCQALARALRARGIEVDLERWRRRSWFHRLARAVQDLRNLVGSNGELILIDDETWDATESLGPLRVRHFVERDDVYWGAPRDDAEAMDELTRLRREGATHLAVAWPAFWWVEHYARFFDEVRASHPCVLRDERLIVFDLREELVP